MPSMPGKFTISAAGSRKTTGIVEDALADPTKRILITTYTIENTAQISRMLTERAGHVPSHIKVYPWFTFLLRECAKPYQSFLTSAGRIKSINFNPDAVTSRLYKRKADVDARYFDNHDNLISEFLTDFINEVNNKSGMLVVDRLERMIDKLYIDEVQDMSGPDHELIEYLMSSAIDVLAVGDPRQVTYSTIRGTVKSKFKGDLYGWARSLEAKRVASIEESTSCYRCNQVICDFADSLYPNLPATISFNEEETGHDGIMQIKRDGAVAYYEEYRPIVLRWNIRSETMGLPAINFGQSKGATYDRVLIFPTDPMKKFLRTGKPEEAGDLDKFYVAVTRARSSVTFAM